MHIPSRYLSALLTLPPLALIALVGAGGKTTTMYTLAHELAAQGKRVITTTTTNIFLPRQDETETLIVSPETPRLLKMIQASWAQHRHITVAARPLAAGKLGGLEPDQPFVLLRKSGADALLVEADGARHQSIKAPADHEPVIPPQTNVVLLLMSAEAINQPLNGAIAHRPEHIARVAGIKQGNLLTPTVIARLMTSVEGGLKSVPPTAAVYLLITHATEERLGNVAGLARLVREVGQFKEILCSESIGAWAVAP